MGVRPEFITIGPKQENAFPAQVNLTEPLGSRTLIFLEAQGEEIRCAVQGETEVKEGEKVHVSFQMERAFLFDRQGKRI